MVQRIHWFLHRLLTSLFFDAVIASADADARAPVTVVEDESELGPPLVVGVDPPQDDFRTDRALSIGDVQLLFQEFLEQS